MTLLNVCDLSHHYAHGGFSGKHQHQAVLNNVSLTLKSGETVALLGRSGCGKSTLARLLVGLESPSQGNISWRGEPLAKLNRAQRKAFRRDIQMVFQDSISAVNPRKTVREIDLLATGSLYILLEEKLAIKPLEATEIISARLPSPLERQLLELTADDVVLSCTRVTLSVERKPMEYVEMVYPASRYSYKARITKDSFSV